MKAKRKKIVIAVVAVVLVVALSGTGVFFAMKNGGEAVKVTLVSSLNQGGWGGSSEVSDYGNVTTNLNQDIYCDASLTITQVFVKEGDTVKIGDPLVAYDTTLLGLELEMKQMEIDGIGLQMQTVQQEIQQLRATTPAPSGRQMAYGATVGGWENDVVGYTELSAKKLIPLAGEGTPGGETNPENPDPTNPENPNPDDPNPDPTNPENPDDPDPTNPNPDEQEPQPAIGTPFPEELQGKEICSTITADTKPYNTPEAGGDGDGSAEHPYRFLCTQNVKIDASFMIKALEEGLVYEFQVVLTDDAGKPTMLLYSWQINGYQEPEPEPEPEPPVPIGPTYEELQREIRMKEQQLTTLSLDKRAAQLELRQLQKKMDTGIVTSTVDGTVKSVLDEENAKLQGAPLISVVGEEGFYITGMVSEIALDRLPVGTPLKVTSWMTGTEYEANVTSISTSPASGYYGSGANMSYYPFTAVIKGDADLKNGEGVGIAVEGMSSGMGESDELYLDQMFVREEGNKYYVYKKGENGKLTKQYVEVGKIIYGSLQILSGLEQEDEIAFPYGKDVKEGAKTETVDSLYEY